MKAREAGNEDKEKISPVALQKEKIAKLEREIERLTKELAKAEDGSLFDLKAGSADEIADVITDGTEEHLQTPSTRG